MAAPTGQFLVGTCDVAYADGTVHTSQINPRKAKAAIKISKRCPIFTVHFVGRLWYPSKAIDGAKQLRWLTKYGYAQGYGKFTLGWRKGFKARLGQALLEPFAYVYGHSVKLPYYEDVPLVRDRGPFPVALFSHGIGGNRSTYSAICGDLASQGFVVLALEHCDGTASAAELADDAGWLYYTGWGDEAKRHAQTRHRMLEAQTATKALGLLSKTGEAKHLCLGSGLALASGFQGMLDMDNVAVIGHSFGGATAGGLAAASHRYVCGVTLDPYWAALKPEEPAFSRWQTASPLLVMLSASWALPDKDGRTRIDDSRQSAVFAAASQRAVQRGSEVHGGGAVCMCIRNTQHASFSDFDVVFGARNPRLAKMVRRSPHIFDLGYKAGADAARTMGMISRCVLAFLAAHMPISPSQRALLRDVQTPLDPTGSSSGVGNSVTSPPPADAEPPIPDTPQNAIAPSLGAEQEPSTVMDSAVAPQTPPESFSENKAGAASRQEGRTANGAVDLEVAGAQITPPATVFYEDLDAERSGADKTAPASSNGAPRPDSFRLLAFPTPCRAALSKKSGTSDPSDTNRSLRMGRGTTDAFARGMTSNNGMASTPDGDGDPASGCGGGKGAAFVGPESAQSLAGAASSDAAEDECVAVYATETPSGLSGKPGAAGKAARVSFREDSLPPSEGGGSVDSSPSSRSSPARSQRSRGAEVAMAYRVRVSEKEVFARICGGDLAFCEVYE